MSEIPNAEALTLFSDWERQNRKLSVMGSNSCCAISLRNARVTICLEDLLQLSCEENGIMRLFVRSALFAPADPKDFPEESGMQIRFANVEMQCFVFPEREKATA